MVGMNSSLIFHVEILFSVFGLSVHFLYGLELPFVEKERNMGIHMASDT